MQTIHISIWLQKILRKKTKLFNVVNLWHVKPLSVQHFTKQETLRCKWSGKNENNTQKTFLLTRRNAEKWRIESDTCFVRKKRALKRFCEHTKRFPCVTVFLYSLFSIYIGVFHGHSLDTPNQINNSLPLLKIQPKRNEIKLSGRTVMVQKKNCRNKSIGIDFCLLNQLIN